MQCLPSDQSGVCRQNEIEQKSRAVNKQNDSCKMPRYIEIKQHTAT